MLKEALKYINNAEEEERIVESTEMWQAAGREVAGRLFEVAPKPGDFGGRDPFAQPPSSFGFDFQQSYPSFASTPYSPMTDTQKNFLRQVARNDEGDPVDGEGNLLMGRVGSIDLSEVPPGDGWRSSSGVR
jgi:hypothetical protein